ncbi:MAG: acetyl-CoA C-acyltransferase [Bacteroidetes bacterium]|nr:MAG: acetyl-CoA C-acyltransferase [Bacteroidota bacterium]
MQKVYILSAVRTPLGSFGGVLSSLSATVLGAQAIKGALERAGIDADQVDEVFMGNVCSANLGQAPARQAALAAGIPNTVPATTVNKVCSSGAKAIMFGAQSIMLGHADIVIAGGMESMSQIPYYIPKARWGHKYGNGTLIDGLAHDGLTDAYGQVPMGVYADKTAEKLGITREQQDAFAIQSYQRASQATEAGYFQTEIVSVSVPSARGDAVIVTEDEEFRKVRFDKIPKLRPAFTKEGTVTAANASTINDGAAALVLIGENKLKELGLKAQARIVSFADAAHEPEWFTTAPTLAAPKALKAAGMELTDIDYFEVNEAFSVVTMAFNKVLHVDESQVNVFGGAVSLGHPLGASGARIVSTLNNVLQHKNASLGLAAICNGGGGASALILERVS